MHAAGTNFNPQPRTRLAEARLQRQWSQHEVADRLGTTHVNVSRWERGITRPSPYFRRKLCQLYGKSAAELDLEPGVENEKQSSSQNAREHAAVPAVSPARTAVFDPAIPLQPPIALVGRDQELAQVKQRLDAREGAGMIALNGLPGIGKTALATALAHDAQMRARFRDGILWAALGPHPNSTSVLSRWSSLLGVSINEAVMNDSAAWVSALRTAIGSRAMLLVIDDAWQIEDSLLFKVGGSHCAHLVTTRFPNIAAAIAVDAVIPVQELNEKESMALLRLLAPGVVERETARSRALVQAVGGLPLALTLMGNYLRKQAYSGQPRRVQAAIERLSDAGERLRISEPSAPVERHSSLPAGTSLSLQSVIAVTDQQLDEQAHSALAALSVFPARPDSFSEEAALQVADCTAATLDTLSDTGFLESIGPGRYTLHQTIADYARLQLRGTAACERLLAFAIAYVEAHKKDYELLEQESNVLHIALEMAYTLDKSEDLVHLTLAFAPYLLVRGLYALAEQHLLRAQQAAMHLNDQHSLAGILLSLGETAQKQGNYAQAEAYYQQGLTIARQLSDPERTSALLNNLGWITWKQGNYTQAETYLQEGLALARQIEHTERISALLEMLGSVSGSRGDYVQSEAYLSEGLRYARQVDDRERICTMLINLGVTAGERGDYAQEKAYYQEGLALARQLGHKEWICALLSNLGDMTSEEGNYDQAEKYFQEGLSIAHQINHREWMSVLLNNLALVTRNQGKYTQAEAYFRESLMLARQISIPQMIAHTLYEYGILFLDSMKIDMAEASFHEILSIISDDNQDLVALAQFGLARVAASRGDMQEAHRLGNASLTILKTIGHRKSDDVKQWLASSGA